MTSCREPNPAYRGAHPGGDGSVASALDATGLADAAAPAERPRLDTDAPTIAPVPDARGQDAPPVEVANSGGMAGTTAGTGGMAGTAGVAGATAGMGGMAGAAGATAGTSGMAGAAGATAGTSGMAGAAGATAGTGGMAGATAGTGGAAGVAGAAGAMPPLDAAAKDTAIPAVDAGTGPEVAPPSCLSHFDFETGLQGWQDLRGNNTPLATTTIRRYAGTRSLAVTLNLGSNASRYIGVGQVCGTADLPPGTAVNTWVWIPTGTTLLAIDPYVLHVPNNGTNAIWADTFSPVSGFTAGAWNKVSVVIPADADYVVEIGLHLYTAATSWSGTVYIDEMMW